MSESSIWFIDHKIHTFNIVLNLNSKCKKKKDVLPIIVQMELLVGHQLWRQLSWDRHRPVVLLL